MIGLSEFQISLLLSPSSPYQAYSRRLKQAAARKSQSSSMNIPLSKLFEDISDSRLNLNEECAVSCIITDSRRVVPGALFFAISGMRTDGNLYIEEAVDRGAVAVVTEEDLGVHFPIEFVQVSDVRKTLALISRKFYEEPDSKLGITGVTGTNGKTTVSMLTQHLMGGQDRVGLLGTIRYDLGVRTLPSFRTTPESVDVFALLAQMVDNQCSEAVMEISSHGIDQKRTYGVDVDVAVFLNLTQDHIDYHKTMESYYEVKKRLFTGETGVSPRSAVINIDCAYGRRLVSELPKDAKVTTFGINSDATIRAEEVTLFADHTKFKLIWPEGEMQVRSPLLGRYNVSNLLAALATIRVKGHCIENLLDRLTSFPGVPGRMERIDQGQAFNVLVDYAHTDDALKNACEMLREITPGRLIVVFGCGGDRDRSKRAPMFRAVIEGADEVFVTSDNPRTEPLEQIFTDMRATEGSESTHYISDRKHAISLALDAAGPEDCVLIAGKGHEGYQEFDGTLTPFDDRQVARDLIRIKMGT